MIKHGSAQPRDTLSAQAGKIAFNPNSWFTLGAVEGLSSRQTYLVSLAAAYASRVPAVRDAVAAQAVELDEEELQKAQTAARMMASEHFDERSLRLVDDEDFAAMRTHLRARVLLHSGVTKLDFESMALAVSTVRGCERSIEAHLREFVRYGASQVQVQAVAAITAVVMTGAHFFQLA